MNLKYIYLFAVSISFLPKKSYSQDTSNYLSIKDSIVKIIDYIEENPKDTIFAKKYRDPYLDRNYIETVLFNDYLYSEKIEPPKNFEKALNYLDTLKKVPPIYLDFWKAYVYYRYALHYITKKNKGEDFDTENFDDKIEKSVHYLEKHLNSNNADIYALLSYVTSISTQSAVFFKVPSISSRAEEFVEKALKIDPNNQRAYSAYVTHNSYVPKMFGGMSKVESYGFKGLSMKEKDMNNLYSPSWGKGDIIFALIRYYKSKENEKMIKRMEKLYDIYFSYYYEN